MFVGDLSIGYIVFGWDTFSEEEKLSKRAIELNNGRAAQMGSLGLMVHELIIPLGYDPDLPIIGHLHSISCLKDFGFLALGFESSS